jgi:ubiquinol-cytochrome c reductase cytochrome c subunit
VTIVVATIGLLYAYGVARFDRRFPRRKFSRTAIAFEGLALGTLWLVLIPFDRYADGSFAAHMAQHVVLITIVAPALVLAAPVRLVLGTLPQPAARALALLLRSPPLLALTSPGVAWLALPAVLWGSHYSGIFEYALEHPAAHVAEHIAYLVAAGLFWSHVFPIPPLPARLSPPARALYVLTAGPPSAFLGVSLWSARSLLYPHYAHVQNPLGLSLLDDQRAGGAIMWIGGSLETLMSLLAVIALWSAAEGPRRRRMPSTVICATVFACALALPGASRAAGAARDLGRTEYAVACASCHGADLRGGPNAPNLRGAGAADVDWWVETGRMPAAVPWVDTPRRPPQLDPDQIDAVVGYVTRVAPGGPAIPQVTTGGDLQHGRALFVENCEHCHGAFGTGATVGGREAAPSLEYPTVTQVGEAVRVGVGTMPKFGEGQISQRDLIDLVTYVDWLRGRRQTPGGFDLGASGPVGEGAVAWIVAALGVTGCAWLLGTSIARKDRAEKPEPVD